MQYEVTLNLFGSERPPTSIMADTLNEAVTVALERFLRPEDYANRFMIAADLHAHKWVRLGNNDLISIEQVQSESEEADQILAVIVIAQRYLRAAMQMADRSERRRFNVYAEALEAATFDVSLIAQKLRHEKESINATR